MIRRLQVEGWRAFDRLSLELEPGVTFVVAENGIGKTSLIEAASWGLYGNVSGIDARGARRFGEGQVRVQVDVELPDGRVLVIDRAGSGRTETLHAAVDRQEVDDAGIAEIMAAAFGASREFLSRTTVLPTAAVADNSAGIFQLHQHLCHAFGVDDLQAAAASLRRVQAAAEAEAKRHRQETGRTADDLAQLRASLAAAEQAVLATENARATARHVVTAAQAILDQARSAHAGRLQAQAVRHLLEELRLEAQPLLADPGTAASRPGQVGLCPDQQPLPTAIGGSATEPDSDAAGPAGFRRQLIEAETVSTSAADRYRDELALIRAQLTAARDALAQLHNADAECPVCRRTLGPDDVATADQAHQQSITQLTEREAGLQALLAAAEQRVQGLRALISRAAQLPSSPAPLEPETAIDIDGAARELDRARAAEDQGAEQAAEARAERNALQRNISTVEASADQQRQSYIAHRREAAASIAAQAMTDTADLILAERINPLVTEITHRWKKVFVNRGELRLQHDGRLVRLQGTHEISFDQFSSGEKVIALLATRLLVLSASTQASFLWLDEPLEHLDPSNRRLAASLMSTAGQHVRQLLLTTYEEKLARRLAKTGGVAIRYVRTAG
jgi:ABC-type transport system involved in cytochrome c biogenesis ATPase subunit